MSELLLTSNLGAVHEGMNISEVKQPWVTLQQYFDIPDERLDSFVERVGQAVEGFSPILIQGSDYAEYGPDNNVPVRRIISLGRGATLGALHTVLGEAIYRHDGDMRNPEWAFEGYNPHITYVDGQALERGELATLQTLELVAKDPASKDKIIQNIWRLEPLEA